MEWKSVCSSDELSVDIDTNNEAFNWLKELANQEPRYTFKAVAENGKEKEYTGTLKTLPITKKKKKGKRYIRNIIGKEFQINDIELLESR